MQSKTGREVTVASTCKTWGCLSCRDRVLNRLKKKIRYGISILGPCWFITLTYKQGEGSQRDALSVAKDWKALLSRLQKIHLRYNQMAWIRVIEVTKKGQPHLHLIVGSLGEVSRTTLASDWKSAWWTTTGDSFIIDVRPVIGPSGAAKYLVKYLVKGVMHREALLDLGFNRRWSASRNWPKGEVKLRGSQEDRWGHVQFVGREDLSQEVEDSKDDFLLERVGPELLVEWEQKDAKRASVATIRKGVMG